MDGDGRALVGRDGAAMDGFREALKSTQDREIRCIIQQLKGRMPVFILCPAPADLLS